MVFICILQEFVSGILDCRWRGGLFMMVDGLQAIRRISMDRSNRTRGQQKGTPVVRIYS